VSKSHSAAALTDRLANVERLHTFGILLLFFLSGVSALVYQICWQRVLFGSFGVDIQSVTIIVSSFMLGLGVGAIAGGALADRFPSRILLLFAASETFIALSGLASVRTLRTVSDVLMNLPVAAQVVVNFAILLIPTSLMGATLPMLVGYLARRGGSVGVSIGGLYFANTLGAATGCYVIGFLWFEHYELPAAVEAAAMMNFAVAILVTAIARRLR